ncbi:MAG: hypothetical protein HXY53_00520 [Nitrospirae bacterium]|nr:hypothetical protein [Nitrospirota bacterium]
MDRNIKTRIRKKGGGLIIALLLFIIPSRCLCEELFNSKSSVEELSNSVLEALMKKDIKVLENLAMTRDEFYKYIWPEIPWSRPKTNMPFEYYWKDLHQKSSTSLRWILSEYGGQKFEFIKIYFAKDKRQYKKLNIYRDSRLIVEDEKGKQKEIELFGSIVELNGRYKILSYIYR